MEDVFSESGVVAIDGKRKNSTVYTTGDGYLYKYNVVSSNKIFYKCTTTKCGARAFTITPACTTITITKEHNHDPDQLAIQEIELRRLILNRCTTESTGFLRIFEEECRKYPPAITSRVSFTSLNSSMKRARAAVQPPLPDTLAEYGATLESPEYNNRFGKSRSSPPSTNAEQPTYYQATVTAPGGGGTSVIFVSERLADALCTAEEVHMDGHFKSRPSQPPMAQIFTIMAMSHDYAFPAVTCLMEKRTREAYRSVLQWLKDRYEGFKPKRIITDFEKALQSAAREFFPEAEISGCLFHSSQAMCKKSMALGLRQLQRDNNDASKAIRMAMSLGLLPANKISMGFQDIEAFVARKGLAEVLAPFMSYVKTTWIYGVGARYLSVYRKPRRTNNDVESYHHWLVQKIGNSKNIWAFTDALIDHENYYVQKLLTVESGGRVGRECRPKYALLDRKIRRANRLLMSSRYSTYEFLSFVSYTMKTTYSYVYYTDDEGEVSPGAAPPPPVSANQNTTSGTEARATTRQPQVPTNHTAGTSPDRSITNGELERDLVQGQQPNGTQDQPHDVAATSAASGHSVSEPQPNGTQDQPHDVAATSAASGHSVSEPQTNGTTPHLHLPPEDGEEGLIPLDELLLLYPAPVNTGENGDRRGRAPRGQAPRGRIPRGRTPHGRTPRAQTPRGRMPRGRIPRGRRPQGRTPRSRTSQIQTPRGVPRVVEGPGADNVRREIDGIEVAQGFLGQMEDDDAISIISIDGADNARREIDGIEVAQGFHGQMEDDDAISIISIDDPPNVGGILEQVPIHDHQQINAADYENINAMQRIDMHEREVPYDYHFVVKYADGTMPALREGEADRQHHELFFSVRPNSVCHAAGSASDSCTICMEHSVTRVCQPCGHRVLCECCAVEFVRTVTRTAAGAYIPKACPHCRAIIGFILFDPR